jgi:hypothetical protein
MPTRNIIPKAIIPGWQPKMESEDIHNSILSHLAERRHCHAAELPLGVGAM